MTNDVRERPVLTACGAAAAGFVAGTGLALGVALASHPGCALDEVGSGLACISTDLGAALVMIFLGIILPWAGAWISCLTWLRWSRQARPVALTLRLALVSVLLWPVLFIGGWTTLEALADASFPSVGGLWYGAALLATVGISALVRMSNPEA